MGYLKQIRGKKWRIVYDVPPSDRRRRRQKTETLFPATKAQAKRILAKREEEVASGRYVNEDITIATLFERFIQAKKAARRAPKTLERYGTLYAAYIGPEFGETVLRNLEQHDVTNAYGRWLAKGKSGRALSARTLHHIHDLLRAMLNHAVRKGLALQNVAALVAEDLPETTDPESAALTEDELRQLLASAQAPTEWARRRQFVSAQSWFAPAVWFGAYTGARRGETLAVRWYDLDLEQGEVMIR